MYQTIIVPIDVCNAEKAPEMLDAAKRLGGSDAKIVLLNVIETVPNYVSVHLPEGHAEKVKAEAIDELNSLANTTPLETEIEVRSGRASPEILAAAEERKADAIIIASHRPGFEDYFLGSTASRVVRHAKCSVIVIR